jgi:hypothetical protein
MRVLHSINEPPNLTTGSSLVDDLLEPLWR